MVLLNPINVNKMKGNFLNENIKKEEDWPQNKLEVKFEE